MDTDFVPLGDSRLSRVLDSVRAEGDAAEAHYLEVKSSIDMGAPLGLAKVAKFVLGAANRLPAQAEVHFRGYAVMVLGASLGRVPGVPKGTESHELHDKLSKYLGPDGPSFDLARLPVSDESEVLFIVVDPPTSGQGPFPCHKDFQPGNPKDGKHALQNGATYVRPDSNTRIAKAPEVLALHARGVTGVREAVAITVETVEQPARLIQTDTFLQAVIESESKHFRESQSKIRSAANPAWPAANLLGPTPKRLSQSEVEDKIATWKNGLPDRWDDCMAYLAGSAFGGIGFRIINTAPSYLNRPRLDVTFHNCHGVEWLDPEHADIDKITPPVVIPRRPFGVIPNLSGVHFKGNPVEWKNVDDDLVVTISLDALRPNTLWVSDTDDLVVLCRDNDAENVSVSWTATVEGRGEQFAGEFELPTHPGASAFELYDRVTSQVES